MTMTWRLISDQCRPARTRELPSCRGRAGARYGRGGKNALGSLVDFHDLEGVLTMVDRPKIVPHSTELRGGACPHSSKASRGEDLDIEEPVRGGDSPAFHVYPTLPSMPGTTLVGDEVVEVR